jgi:hypothetical protein
MDIGIMMLEAASVDRNWRSKYLAMSFGGPFFFTSYHSFASHVEFLWTY